jgi:hypothetical protein
MRRTSAHILIQGVLHSVRPRSYTSGSIPYTELIPTSTRTSRALSVSKGRLRDECGNTGAARTLW